MQSSSSEDAIKAVLFTEFFGDQLQPLFSEPTTLKALLPIVNVPLLTYQLEALSQAGIRECIIVCREESKEILNSFLKNLSLSMLQVHFLASNQWLVPGDALRELDVRGDLRPQNDFLLISPGVFFTVNTLDIVKQHRARRQQSKNWIATVCFSSIGFSSLCDIARLETGQLLQYTPTSDTRSKFVVPNVFGMTNYTSLVEIFSSVEDCGIDICSPEFLVEFRENFDYDHIRDFVREKIAGGEGELLGNQIYAHIFENYNDFACRITNIESYFHVCRSFVHRWSYPWTVEQFPSTKTEYSHRRGRIYLTSSTHLARSSMVGRCTVLGKDTRIGDYSVVEHSVIGDHVEIGKHCRVINSIIWSHTQLDSEVIVKDAVIGNHVVLKDSCSIPRGCVLGPFVIIGTGIHIPENARVALKQLEDISIEHGNHSYEMEVSQVGVDGKGYLMFQETHLDEKDNLTESSVDELETTDMIEDEVDNKRNEDIIEEMSLSNQTKDAVVKKEEQSVSPNMDRMLIDQEIKDTFQRALEEGHSPETAVLELNALKLAMDVTSFHVLRVIFPLLLVKLQVDGSSQVTRQWHSYLETWSKVLSKYCTKASDAQWIMEYWRTTCEQDTKYQKYFLFVIQVLYDCDVLDEDWIIEWFMKERQINSTCMEQLRPFVEWLQEAEETSSED
eukprot:jgi/Galph1/572/GphlegSOOS_G5320.1